MFFCVAGRRKMSNIDFVIWMLGYPLVCTLSSWVHEKILNREYSEKVRDGAVVVCSFIWGYVGWLLYD